MHRIMISYGNIDIVIELNKRNFATSSIFTPEKEPTKL